MRDGPAAKVILGPMLYTINQRYFADAEVSFFKKAVLVTAVAVGEFCRHHTDGPLPEGYRQKEVFIEAMVKKILSGLETDISEEFAFFLDPLPVATIQRQGGIAKFDHRDDTSSWVLAVTEGEFKKLQHAWRAAGLPLDLFKSFCHDIVRPK
jgi:hypothetical protein